MGHIFLINITFLMDFSAWSIISTLSPSNAHIVLFSTIGVHVCVLPGRMLLASTRFFLVWLLLLISVMACEFSISMIMKLAIVMLFVRVVSTFSALTHLFLGSGALGECKFFSNEEGENMKPVEFSVALIERVQENRKKWLEIMTSPKERDSE